MNRDELLLALRKLPKHELLEVFSDLFERISRPPLVGRPWDPKYDPPPVEELSPPDETHEKTARLMVELGLFINDRIRRYCEHGLMTGEIRRRESWPCTISFHPRRADYYERVIRHLEEEGLGKQALRAADKASRHSAKSRAAEDADTLLDIIGYWREPSPVGQVATLATKLGKEHPALIKLARKLPPFSTETNWTWWESVAFPLAIAVNPELKPQKRGRRKAGEEKVDKKINEYRKQLRERFLDLAPGVSKSRSSDRK
ncbi:MAG TPA: hypothetical protein VGM54_19650 [Chthoniobacter sp.]|jgi:hypothetical protein